MKLATDTINSRIHLLKESRLNLLRLHKLLVDIERENFENLNGKITSGHYLNLLVNDSSFEFYWLNRWYNVFRFHEPDGNLRNFYCNINLPFKFAGNILDYVDLDIDILVWKDFSYQILDSDEFLENAKRFSYSDEMRKKVRAARDELISLIETRTFPFDYKFCT